MTGWSTKACRRPVLAIAVLTFCLAAARSMAAELPPPPRSNPIAQEQLYRLELVINQYPTGLIVPVRKKQDNYWISADHLLSIGMPAHFVTAPETNLSQIAGVSVNYDSAGQRLLLQVPPQWLPTQQINRSASVSAVSAQSGTGALFNYDAYASQTQHQGAALSVWNELRFFSAPGSLSLSGVLKQPLSHGEQDIEQGYVRYDTSFRHDNEQDVLSWVAGDFISGALSWSNSVRMGGIQVSRDFTLRPDIVTYPLPSFSGSAAVPTTADLFINGYKSSSTNLQSGPFTITDTPYINGAGEAVLVTTDALGRQISTTLPFYVANTLLGVGLSDFSASAGALRRDYGHRSFSYGPAGISASYRYGATNFLTLEGHVEGARSLAMLGVGSVLQLGRWGVFSGSFSASGKQGESGNQYSVGYQYNNAVLSLNAQHIQRDNAFRNLALYDTYTAPADNAQPIFALSRSSTQYSAALSLGRYGSLGAAYFDIQSFADDRTRLFNLSWNKNVWHNSNLSVTASHDPANNSWTTALSLQIPFGALSSATLSYERNAAGQHVQQLSYTQSVPSDGGFGWNVAYSRQHPASDYQQASLSWRNEHVQLQGGAYGSSGKYTQWGNVTGSLVTMDGHWLAANKINDAFVVVSTLGYPGMSVNYEHQPVGKTDQEGYLLIPNVPSYYSANYGIDTLNLPVDVVVAKTQAQVAVRRHSGYMVAFPIQQQQAASIILVDDQGKPLPVSSLVTRTGYPATYVGWDGLVYLEKITQNDRLQVKTPAGQSCQALIRLPDVRTHKLQTYGPFTCKFSPSLGAGHE